MAQGLVCCQSNSLILEWRALPSACSAELPYSTACLRSSKSVLGVQIRSALAAHGLRLMVYAEHVGWEVACGRGRSDQDALGPCMTPAVTVPPAVAVTEPCDTVGGDENLQCVIMRIRCPYKKSQIRVFGVAYFANLASKMVLYELSGTVSGRTRVLAGLGGDF